MLIQGQNDLLAYLVDQAEKTGNKNWFSFRQQRIAGVDLCYQIAALHADKMTPDAIVEYVNNLNDVIYQKLLKIE